MSDGAKYFRPPHAVTCWVDDTAVYVELPMGETPYIQRFPITEAGFHKALMALKDIHKKIGKSYVLSVQAPPVRRYTKLEFTEEQYAAAREILTRRAKP